MTNTSDYKNTKFKFRYYLHLVEIDASLRPEYSFRIILGTRIGVGSLFAQSLLSCQKEIIKYLIPRI